MVPGTLAGEICTMLGFRRASDADPALVLGQMDQDGILTLHSTSVTLGNSAASVWHVFYRSKMG